MSRKVTPTYTLLNQITLTAASSSVTFSNIPQNFGDLVLSWEAVGSIDENLTPTLNGSSSDFSWVQMTSGPSSGTGTNNSIGRVSTSRNIGKLEFFDYSALDKHKTFLVRTQVSGSEVRQLAARWAQNTAISSIGLGIRTGGSFAIGSTFSLYGVVA